MKVDLEEMIEELEQYYEAAGFSNFKKRVLDKMTEEQIISAYEDLMNDEDYETPIDEDVDFDIS